MEIIFRTGTSRSSVENFNVGYMYNPGSLPNHKEIEEIIKILQQFKNKMTNKEIEEQNEKEWDEQIGHSLTKNEKEKNKEGYIYVIKSTKHYKIGRTLKPKQRIKKYVTENSDEIEVILCEKVKDYIEVEKNLHWILKHKNHNREWFNLNDVDLHIVEDYIEGKKYGNI